MASDDLEFPRLPRLPRRILVVEDDPACVRALTRLLVVSGYEVQGATSLSQAMELLVWQPEIVLLDLMLPDGSGVDLLSVIRGRGRNILVAVVSAAPQELLDRAAQFVPDAVFRKPVEPAELLSWLKRPTARGSQ